MSQRTDRMSSWLRKLTKCGQPMVVRKHTSPLLNIWCYLLNQKRLGHFFVFKNMSSESLPGLCSGFWIKRRKRPVYTVLINNIIYTGNTWSQSKNGGTSDDVQAFGANGNEFAAVGTFSIKEERLFVFFIASCNIHTYKPF